MYADDHQMYIMGKKYDVVAQSIKTQNESKLYPGTRTTISQPTQKSFSYLQLTREMLTQTMIIKIFRKRTWY